MTDTAANYDTAIAALRLRVLMSGEATPRDHEPVDLLLTAVIVRQKHSPPGVPHAPEPAGAAFPLRASPPAAHQQEDRR